MCAHPCATPATAIPTIQSTRAILYAPITVWLGLSPASAMPRLEEFAPSLDCEATEVVIDSSSPCVPKAQQGAWHIVALCISFPGLKSATGWVT